MSSVLAGSPASSPAAAPTRLEGASWLLSAALAAYVVAQATWTRDAVVATHVAALLAIGSLLFRGSGGQLFRVAFAMNVAWTFVLAAAFTGMNGVPFSGGGDDILFFETSARVGAAWADGNWSAHQAVSNYSGFGYILLGAALRVISSPVGDAGPLVIRVWGAFAGATIGPAVVLLAKALLPDRGAVFWTRTAAVATLFPIVTYFAAIGLRDIWLAAAATWVIGLLASARADAKGFMAGWIAPGALLMLSAIFRPESAVPLVAFWLALLYARRDTTVARVASVGIVAITVALATLFREQILAQLIQQQLSYAYAADAAGQGSLGARILAIQPPAGWVARYVYAIVTPIPPMVALRADTILIGVGATAWYFAVPLAIDGWRTLRARGAGPRSIADAVGVFVALLLLGIALTSIDVRHKVPLIPVTLVLAACAVETHDARWRYDRFILVALVGLALGAAYLILKFT